MKAFYVVLFALSALLVALARPALTEPVIMENEFIRVVVNGGPEDAGRFSIRTTVGDPQNPLTKNQHLVFGASNAPYTSYTTVLVDGEPYVFGGPTLRRAGLTAKSGKLVTPPTKTDDGIVTVCRLGDIQVTQKLAFARGMRTRLLDTLGISYKIENMGTAAHKVGLRVLLDTMCGANDGAPIRAGGDEAFTRATVLPGKDAPDFWMAFDTLTNPTVVSQGTLRGEHGTLTPPDKIIFADWGTLADDPWQPKLDPGKDFVRKGETDVDTAAAMLWEPVELAPDRSVTYTTHYGVGYLKFGPPAVFNIALNGPADATFEHERTDTFTVTGFVQYNGSVDARDVNLTLKLPDGLTLVEGSAKSGDALMKKGDIVQRSWRVRPNGLQGGKKQIVLAVTSANAEPNEGSLDIQLNVPPATVKFTPAQQTVQPETDGLPTLVPVQINLVPADGFHGVRLTVKYDEKVVRPLGAPFGALRGRAFVENGRLLKWSYNAETPGVVILSGSRIDALPLTQAEINLAIIKFRVVGEGKCTLKLENAVAVDKDGKESPLDVSGGEIIVAPAH